MDKNHIVEYKVFENNITIHSGKIPLHLVVGGRAGDNSLEGMWLPEWKLYETRYPGAHRRVEIYLENGSTFYLQDDASFYKL